MRTHVQRYTYVIATFERMAKDVNYSREQAATDIARVWAEDVDDNRSDAQFVGAMTGQDAEGRKL